MLQQEKKESTGNPELGFKLLSFRKKLALSIGQKKITQSAFGEMYGGYSGRVIASYELGDVEPPASFIYLLWKCGHSIDNIFGEGPITEIGGEKARQLYDQSIMASLKTMDESERERVQKEASGVKQNQNIATAKTASQNSPKSKNGHFKTRKIKKR